MNQITAQDVAAVDDTAAWGASNVTRLPAGPVTNPRDGQSHTAMRQSLNHYCHSGRRTEAQERHDNALLRAYFLKAEAEVLWDEQWSEYVRDSKSPISRTDSFEVNTCMHLWTEWDKRMHDLYHSLLERAEAAEAEAKYGAAKL